MKLYHASNIENLESIKENGLQPSLTQAISQLDDNKRINIEGIYGFTNIKDALEFARDNNFEACIILFEIDEELLIKDPEYDGEAYFYKTNNSLENIKIIER